MLARALPSDVGFYVDVGAADPLEFSVTKLFYDRGWSGINIEPQEDYFRKLVADRPRDINLQFAITDRPGSMTFHVAPTHPGWATVNELVAQHMVEQGIQTIPQVVRSVTLADVCALYVPGSIDFLKIDVEGAERNVLMGADFKRWRPRIVVIEATEQGGATPNHHLWEDLILAEDYLFATFDGLNRYYVRAEDADLVPILQVPVNVFDLFAPFEHQSRIWELKHWPTINGRSPRKWAWKQSRPKTSWRNCEHASPIWNRPEKWLRPNGTGRGSSVRYCARKSPLSA